MPPSTLALQNSELANSEFWSANVEGGIESDKQSGSIFHGEDILQNVMDADVANISSRINEVNAGSVDLGQNITFFQTTSNFSLSPNKENSPTS